MIPPDLDAFLLERVSASRMPGLSLVLLSGDETHERHVGFRDLSSRVPPGGDTRYGIGSVTKLFTALATLRLAGDGALTLDDPIAAHLPEIADAFPPDTTIADLLAHASGLPALGFSESKMSDRWYPDGLPVGGWPDVASFLTGADAWWADAPGTRWRYSNEGYLALGALIERTTGETYVGHVARTLLGPSGMTRSTFDREVVEADADRVTPLMVDDEGRFVPGANLYGPVPAAGGLVSTPRDLATFARRLMDALAGADDGAWLGPRVRAWLAEPRIALDPEGETPLDDLAIWDDPRRWHGLGPQLIEGLPGLSGFAIGHGGGVMGGTAYLLVAPERRIGVVALANTHGYPLARVAMASLVALAERPLDALAWYRRERLGRRLAGDYAAFRNTMRAEVRPAPGGLELVLAFRPARRRIPLTYLDHDDATRTTRMVAWSQGRPALATFRPTSDPDAPIELRFDRYAFRRQGRLLP
jgi:CubicO group peptidase (beta-lactamase class C family)